ncbi:hypothetical protein THASP1DRAFT_20052 [Thamnocephalis sphaerospora]|uniref:Tim17/Tim22/Tim23/Pmp24 family-domain-containing protein n=1 Tax=Thamnocephalis sphaerospora TaxID=78915 RepID=A0A4P9XHP4_9FUNG|nr:hypothetical protein THASP1DRAFT_20052 [Thamnocephalis sphaerospora]|eukprot:RKP05224.1 hypothetical protein THASP1DRAFT_20052 [Thamnocephalis sphaerospora]
MASTFVSSDAAADSDTLAASSLPGPLSRVGIEPGARVGLVTGMGAFWGFAFGAFLGGRQSGLQYLAENAHKLPRTKEGWYFYHKTKNYRVLLGATRQGMRYAGRTGAICLLYSGAEAWMDRMRGHTSPLHSIASGVTTASVYALLAGE